MASPLKGPAPPRSLSAGDLSRQPSATSSRLPVRSQALTRVASGTQLPPLRHAPEMTLPSMTRLMRNPVSGQGSMWSTTNQRSAFRPLEVQHTRISGNPKGASKGAWQESRAKTSGPGEGEKVDPLADMPWVKEVKSMYINPIVMDDDDSELDEESQFEPVDQNAGLDEMLQLNNGGVEVDEDEILRAELAKLKTGEDAIAFFARNGSGTKVKLLYCNRAEPKDDTSFAPYDLVIVPEDKVNPEYFTVSSNGLVHILPKQLCEHISLVEWMHQSLMYRVLTSMVFFKFYIHKKVINQWRINARYEVYCNNRQKLSRSCFFAKPLFVEPLVQMHSIVSEVEEVKVLLVDQNVYNLSDFSHTQQQVRQNQARGALKELESKHDQLIVILDRLTQTVRHSIEVDPIADMDAKNKSKSMVQEKLEAKERGRHERLARHDHDMLGDAIRMVDYMFQAAMVVVALRATEDFKARLEQGGKLFFMYVSFGRTSVELAPSLAEFVDMLDKLWDGVCHVINTIPSFTSVRQFEPFIKVLNHLAIKDVIVKNRKWIANTASIHLTIKKQVEEGKELANTTYLPFRRIHDYSQQWNEEAFIEQGLDADQLYEKMALVKEFKSDLDCKVKLYHVSGILYIDGKSLRSESEPVLDEALGVMKKLLMNLAAAKCRETLAKYAAVNASLDDRPKDLGKYTAYVRTYKQIKEDVDDMEATLEVVQNMFTILQQYKHKIPMEEEMSFEKLIKASKAFEDTKMLEAKVYMDDQSQGMVEDTFQRSEKIEQEAQISYAELFKGNFMDPERVPYAREVLEELEQIGETQVKHYEKMAATYGDYEDLLGIRPSAEGKFEFAELTKLRKAYDEKYKLWEMVAQWQDLTQQWNSSDFLKVDTEAMNKTVNNMYRLAYNLTKSLNGDEVAARTKTLIETFRENLPVIMDLGNPAMQARHWERIFKKVNLPWKGQISSQNVSLSTLEGNGIFDHKEFVSEISANASGEYQLECSLNAVIKAWQNFPLPIMNHRNQKELWILGDLQDIITQCEDHSVTIATMMGSRFIVGIRDSVEVWEKKINVACDIIDEWYQVQRAWMYLENIFSAEDIQAQLPSESAKFKTVDKFWKDLFKKVRQTYSQAIDAFQIPQLLPMLKNANDTLDHVQKRLEAYLETKRAAFPRFYFLSNDELLSILSQTRNPHAVQEHMCKCFDSINRVEFSTTEKANIIGMSDMIKERVPFVDPVVTGPIVEKWLAEIEVAMVNGLYDSTKKSLVAYPADGTNRTDWLLTGPFASQSQLMNDQIWWTRLAEEALMDISTGKNAQAMKDCIKFHQEQLKNSVGIVRMQLTKLQRVLMGALIVLDVHGITVLENLAEANVQSVDDFDWSKQLRYYWIPAGGPASPTSLGSDVEDDCVCRQTISAFKYSYEYLGNTPRLVVTPLTDKCYMTLTGAMHLYYGGAPAGPAGTGKTETTKDLGKALAVPIIVFNCSDGLDYKIMGRFFSGLAQAGAWACFDEFNRIQVEVLSVIAQQMLTVTQAIRAKKEYFEFLGKDIPLNRRFGVYITMNPGYAGRAELPDNLKALFRPVAMMVPDYGLIAEIILYSEGFNGAKLLARKMVNLYRLSSEQLSKQDHYDFGMRAVKSVLVMAGHLKRQNPDLAENITLIRALRDSNAPKFLSFDLPLFNGIITDLYPEVSIPDVDYGNLKVEIENQLRLMNLQIVSSFITKITQLLETQLVRHGVMLVGLTMTGKSTDSMILSKTLTQLKKDGSQDPAHQHVKVYFLNPKSITADELYGSFNLNTGEWKDGLVAILVREAVSDTSDNKKWVNFDGPVDAIWIENMNTVLDDNKMLCLSNGERIKLPPSMTVMFEVGDLAVASPATVSRCGMVYLEPVHLGWKPLIETWIERFKVTFPRHAENLGKWAKAVCEEAIPFIREECQEAPGIPSMDNNLVATYLRMLNTFIAEPHGIAPEQEGSKPVRTPEQEDQLARLYCAMGAMWSLGANLHENSRKKFVTFIRPKLQRFCNDIPDEGDLYKLSIDDEAGKLQHLSVIVPDFTYDINEAFFNILVPTSETTGQRILLANLMRAGFNALISGETGVGKSVVVQQFLNTAGDNYAKVSANFSAQTNAGNVVDILENRLERKRKNLLGAPPGTTMLVFVDDMNMPMLEYFGAQPPIELLRQVVDYGGFYDKKKLFWKNVADTQWISACGPPGGGRMVVTPRLIRHFCMMWTPALPQDSMIRILSSIMGGWLGVVKPDLQDLAEPIVKATVDMFFTIATDLLPTPVKCHYTFNLRDPAKMLQGILMVNVKLGMKDKSDLMNLFLHESSRQFRDRLIDDTDREWFNKQLAGKLNAYIPRAADPEAFKDIIFGNFLDRGEKPYQQVPSEKKCVDIFQEWLDDYNSTNPSKMNIVFFRDCVHHVARATRTIGQPRGNMLLVGVSGVGRKSVARIAAHMADYVCYSIEITRTYGPNEFKEDIKAMMLGVAKSGGKGMMFLFSDTQIVKESFLEDINNILNTGEVPNLFAPDELEQILGLMRPIAKQFGKETKDQIWQYFVQVIRENLHIVLAFSPIGDSFRGRCRQFPSIINCAAIDWYSSWPPDALLAVAERYYGAAPKELALEKLIPQLSAISQIMHSSSRDGAEKFYDMLRRRTYMTPTSYLELIGLFTDMLGAKRGQLTTKLNRYVVGTKTLSETKQVVDDLKVKLTAMQPVIEQAKKDTADLIVKVDNDKAIANEKSEACAVDAKIAAAASAEATVISEDCQRDLDEALPAYHSAIKSLDSLDKKDIQEIKSFAKPPPLVEVVLSAVCLLFGNKESWDEAKKMMGDTKFLDNLRNYDKDALAADKKLTAKLQKYMKREDFVPEKVKAVSMAAMSLCLWVRAMDIYGRVSREIGPKKEKLAAAEAAKDEANEKLAIKKAELQIVLDNVASLEAQLKAAKAKSEQLDRDAQDCNIKLNRAEKLLAGLGNEAVRWNAASTILEKNLNFVIGNIVLAGGFIAYAGAFTSEFRKELVATWLKEAVALGLGTDPRWRIDDVLVDPAEVRKWNIASLPSDDLSIENGIMVTRGRRWPLMIDPQGQANRWVRHMGKEKNIVVTKLSDSIYLRKLEAAIRNGNAMMIENVEEVLDPAIEPVLTKAIFKRGAQKFLRLGTEDIPYHDDFGFFITTKMANPHYLPEVCIKVTIINFTVTLLGLDDQLVAEVIASERPDLAQQRTELVVQIAADKKTQDELEQLILKLLADAAGDVLKDDSLNITLDQSKKTGGECQERMIIADKAMAEIDGVREKLRPVATRASILYFIVADLAKIDPMYQYSLEFFVGLFQKRLRESEPSEDIDKRIMILIEDVSKFIFLNICRGLFEDHKLIFSFLITCQILRNNAHCGFLGKKTVTMTQWLFFLRSSEAGKGVLDEKEPDIPCPSYVPVASWGKLDVLCRLAAKNGETDFDGLMEDMAAGGAWQKFCTSDSMHSEAFPPKWAAKLSAFQKMIIVKSLRENFLTLVSRNVVAKELGDLFIESPPFDLAAAFNDSVSSTPLIFVLSAGADPTEYLLSLATDRGYRDRLHFISLGQGQGPKAEALVKLGWDTGDWVCLQNCHLAASWMPKLESIQESLDPLKISEDYRLWLTSMPSPLFPVPVLQKSIKITNEPPKGLRANLGRTFQDLSEDIYEACAATKPMEYKTLLFGLSFFHAVILERRKFGPIGWNIPYEWMDSDFQVSREQVRMYLVAQPDVPWTTLRYIIAEVNYGGRVTDDKDVRLIAAVLKGYFCPEMMKEGFRYQGLDCYYPPGDVSLSQTRDYCRNLPMDEDPRVFGLHPNALITAQFNQAKAFMDTIVSVQPRITSGGGGKSSEEIVAEMAKEFLQRIPDAKKTKEAHPDTYKKIPGGGIVSIGVFHGQEYARFTAMISRCKASLKMLDKAIQGIVLMSGDLEGMFNAFLVQKVPGNWEKVAYPCLKPLNSWVVDFIQRVHFITNWLVEGPPKSYWISSFFFPQGFMTASLQVHARKTKIPIDTLEFFSTVTDMATVDDVTRMPENGANLHGLFLMGCGWDVKAGMLRESNKDILYEVMPVIWLEPIDCTDVLKRIKERNLYECPIYKTSERKGTLSTTGHSTNFVKYFPLSQPGLDTAHWISRGVAMLCMLDD